MLSLHHARNYERFWSKVERAAREEKEDPSGYHRPVPGKVRVSKATAERLRMIKHDINTDPLKKGIKIKNADQLINMLIDSVFTEDRPSIEKPINEIHLV